MSDLWASQFSPDVANRYRRDQIRSTIDQMRLLMAGNVLFAPCVAWQVWGVAPGAVIMAWAVSAMFISIRLLVAWTDLYHTDGRASDMHEFIIHSALNGIFWFAGMLMFFPLIEGDGKIVFTTIMTGALALGTLGWSRAAVPSLVYLVILSAGCGTIAIVHGLSTKSSADVTVGVLAYFAGITLVGAVLERGRASAVAFRNHEKVIEKTEVIELLLNDYEQQATEWLWRTNEKGSLIAAPDIIVDWLDIKGDLPTKGPILPILQEKSTSDSSEGVARLAEAVKAVREFNGINISLIDPQTGDMRWIDIKGRPQFEKDKFLGFRGIMADVTATKEAERKVSFLATHDSLTKLLNRNSVRSRLTALSPQEHTATAFLIDLDGFKGINDSYGHETGDALLRAASDRLRQFQSPHGWAARLAGDEFLIVIEGLAPGDTQALQAFGDDICDRLSEPFKIDNFELQISASVGIARFPEDTRQAWDMLSLSDLALYEAKNRGRDRAKLFDKSMLDKLHRRVAVIERLKAAVRNGDIQPHYQSQHRLADHRLIGFEALARWTDKDLGFIGPDVFIPIAEQTGLIVDLGEHLLRTTCRQAKIWERMLGPDTPIVSVNISPVQFARTDVPGLMTSILSETGLPAQLIEIEVTESVLISDKRRVAAQLNELSEMGVSIALDDFGTGYSSLSYLKELPLNRLKIDRSFVNDLEQQDDNPIVSTVVQLGHSLGLNVIAEGVETAEQLEWLQALGCDDGQGYFFSRPIPVEDANDLVVIERLKRTTRAG